MLIYLADDEVPALSFLLDTLKEVEPQAVVVPFRRAGELLEAMQKTPCDVVFTDVRMPGITGIELAKQLKACKSDVNIIFVTGYDDYMADALALFASGYVLKPPTAADIRRQLNHLRYPLQEVPHVRIRTFGNFSVYVDEVPVTFGLTKSLELLAYLVDRNGKTVSRKDLYEVLFEDGDFSRNAQKNLSKIVHTLEETLHACGADSLFVREADGYRIEPSGVSCDLYDYLAGKGNVTYHGEYMEQFSWAEKRKGLRINV